MFNEKDMDFWIQNNLNVLFIGKHGVGKTARVIEAFDKHNLKWKYFSASTIDPWVDFVGIPKELSDPNGHSYISFIRPKDIEDDQVEAIFFDEFNRAPKKVLNAVMELIQFKSINGKKLNNLRFIWAAVNMNEDDDDTYSVEKIDPAQLDRFQIHIDVPYKLDRQYFTAKYSRDIYNSVSEWWGDLTSEVRDKVSPRRVDYAIDVWQKGGNVMCVLPKEANTTDLLSRLASGPFFSIFTDLVKNIGDTQKIKTAFADQNFASWINKNIEKTEISDNFHHFVDYINADVVSGVVVKKNKDLNFVNKIYNTATGRAIITEIIKANKVKPSIITNLKKLTPAPLPTPKGNKSTRPQMTPWGTILNPATDDDLTTSISNAVSNVVTPPVGSAEYTKLYRELDTTYKRSKEYDEAWEVANISQSADALVRLARSMAILKERSHAQNRTATGVIFQKRVAKLGEWLAAATIDDSNKEALTEAISLFQTL